MDDLGAIQLGLHRPPEGNGITFGHVGALNHHAVGEHHIARVRGRSAATQACPQTGDARAVSDTGLILDGHDP